MVSLLIDSDQGIPKNRMRVRRLFEKVNGFNVSSVIEQIESGSEKLSLGECAENDVNELIKLASDFGVKIEAVRVE
jgi:hypothetical protein